MPASDRVFRALGRAVPECLLHLVRAIAPAVVPAGLTVDPASVDDPHLDAPPPPLDADWIARVGPRDLLHVECQGYADNGFPERVFDYHVRLVARYPGLRVHTVALWLIAPPRAQQRRVLRRADVRISIVSALLPELPAEALLAHPRTACFAPGADAGASSARRLCRRVARALREGDASWHERRLACIVATVAGRYKEMVKAMRDESIEPVLLTEAVMYGEDVGFAKGLKKGVRDGRRVGVVEGREEGRRVMATTLLDLYQDRFGDVPREVRDAFRTTEDLAKLAAWVKVVSTGEADDVAAAVLGRRRPKARGASVKRRIHRGRATQ